MIRLLAMLLLLNLWISPLTGNTGSSHSFPPETQARLQEVLDELRQVEERLRSIRREAEATPALYELKNGIDRDILAELPVRFPEHAEEAARLRSLLNELSQATEIPESERERTLAEFHDLRTELQPQLHDLRELPEFRKRIGDYEQRVQETMKEKAPVAAELISRRAALHIQFNRLQREALQAVRGEEHDEETYIESEPGSSTRWVFPPSRQRY